MPYEVSAINDCYKIGRFPSLRVRTDDRSKVRGTIPFCRNPCSCARCCGRVVIQDDCTCSGACGKQVYGCIRLACQHNPRSNLRSCHDHAVNTINQDDCESWRDCGNKVPVFIPSQ